jgi:predicted RNA-binding Zn ribbon-like protein
VNFSHYTDLAVRLAAGLVNTYDTSGPDDEEHLATAADLEAFLRLWDLDLPGRITGAAVGDVRDLRERLRAVFDARDEAQAATRLNRIVADAGVQPLLTNHDGEWHLHYTPDGTPLARRLAAMATMALVTVIAEFGFGRLKVCESETCRNVLVDTSRNQSRRYCSDRCANRENVAAYRARRRAAT